MAVSDDDIIKRKLLIEGEGGNDDARINRLLKTFTKWASSNDSEDDRDENYQKMIIMLANSEYAMEKNLIVYKMNEMEQSKYQALNIFIENEIEKAHKKISESKHEVLQAKRIRRNRQEYDALAKVIQQHPDRQETQKELEKLDKELEKIQSSNRSLEQQLELRKKQFHVLIAAIHEIQRILEDDEPLDVNDELEQDEEPTMDTT